MEIVHFINLKIGLVYWQIAIVTVPYCLHYLVSVKYNGLEITSFRIIHMDSMHSITCTAPKNRQIEWDLIEGLNDNPAPNTSMMVFMCQVANLFKVGRPFVGVGGGLGHARFFLSVGHFNLKTISCRCSLTAWGAHIHTGDHGGTKPPTPTLSKHHRCAPPLLVILLKGARYGPELTVLHSNKCSSS